MKIVEYMIVRSFDTTKDMAARVNIQMTEFEGQWQPYGSPFVFRGDICQAMVKYEDEKK